MSEASTARLSRLLTLVPWLAAHSGVSKETAAAHFDVTVAQLEADLELITFTGPGLYGGELVDIHFADESITVYDSQGLDRPLRLSPDEIASLLVALRALQQLPDSDTTAIASCIDKLSGGGETAEELAVTVHSSASAAIVAEAITCRRNILIRYLHPLRDDATDRLVTPTRMFSANGIDYVEGWCHAAEAHRTFRIDRMLSCSLGEEQESIPGVIEEPVARFRAQVVIEHWAQHVLEGVPATVLHSNEHIEAAVDYVDDRWLVQWAVIAGAGVRITLPTDVQRRARDRADAALLAYGSIAPV